MADGDQKRTCGIVRPIAGWDGMPAEHWGEVHDIIVDALNGEFDVHVVSEADAVGVIHGRIVKNLNSMDLVICDVSGRNPNVMFEFGMRLAFDKPTIAIKDDATEFSFDTSPLEHMLYPRSLRFNKIVTFKEDLRRKAVATVGAVDKPGYQSFLQHFGPIQIASLEREEVPVQALVLEQMSELTSRVNQLLSRPSEKTLRLVESSSLKFGSAVDYKLDDMSIEGRVKFLTTVKGLSGVKDVSISTINGSPVALVYFIDGVNGRGTAAMVQKIYDEMIKGDE